MHLCFPFESKEEHRRLESPGGPGAGFTSVIIFTYMDLHDLDGQHIALFDGICNLCNWSVIFILEHDRAGVFRFASIQSRAGAKLLNLFNLPETFNQTVIYLENGKPYFGSLAALGICARLCMRWPVIAGMGMVVLGVIRDLAYRSIAENRYKWFGRRDACLVPGRELLSRFL